MKNVIAIYVCSCLVCLFISSALTRDTSNLRIPSGRTWSADELTDMIDPELRGYLTSTAADPYTIVHYDFESGWQGWTRVDNTAQKSNFFHVDDFNGIAPGSHGRLIPINGTKSMWCGTRPNSSDPYLGSWLQAPGYGNGWNQTLETDPFTFTGIITFSFHGVFDSESNHDFTYVEFDAGDNNWQRVATYTGVEEVTEELHIAIAKVATKLRFHFISDDSGSDQDGLWNTDGGAIVDDLHISDNNGIIDFEDFESAEVNAKDVGIWHSRMGPAFGMYSGLQSGLVDHDPCNENLSRQVMFFDGSPYPSTEYPGLYNRPCCEEIDGTWLCQDEMIVSPTIYLGALSKQINTEAQDRLDWYFGFSWTKGRVALQLGIQHDGSGGYCEFPICTSGNKKAPESDNVTFNITARLIEAAENVNITIRVLDLGKWYAPLHPYHEKYDPFPLFDNVKLSIREGEKKPVWEFNALNLFQDCLIILTDLNLESFGEPTLRLDASLDTNPLTDPHIRRGDSVVVRCASPFGGGLADDNGYPAVYLHVKCTYLGAPPEKPDLFGPALQGTYGRYIGDNGLWTIIQGDTARTGAGKAKDLYMFDLNDSLLTQGYCIEYYFMARDNDGDTSTLPPHADIGQYFEATCLPTGKSDVLYVNDAGPIGCLPCATQCYWDQTFKAVFAPPNDVPDRFDVNDPSAIASPGGPGGQIGGADLASAYRMIIWDCGDFSYSTISDGTFNSDKSNDCQMLIDWMNLSSNACGLWICGDDIASDLKGCNSGQALTLLNYWCGVDLVSDSYFEMTGGVNGGGITSPIASGDADLGLFVHGGIPDQWYVFGGCPVINLFDVLACTGSGRIAATYPEYESSVQAAAVSNHRTNDNGYDVRTMWFGFGYQNIRDDVLASPIDRFTIAEDVINWLEGNTNPDVTEAVAPIENKLHQNFPNPFNPITVISFDMKEKGFVSIVLYNVAGQRVRTLVSEIKEPGSYTMLWDGRNDKGTEVASGIYFYDMKTRNFCKTRKLVLLR